jgi:hypothetical protein
MTSALFELPPRPPSPALTSVVLAIDPGPELSAWVLYRTGEPGTVADSGKDANANVLERLHLTTPNGFAANDLVIEQIAAMGMAVGAETFETVFWSGRFVEAWQDGRVAGRWHRVKRHQVKTHLCGNQRAKDPNIRQALIDRWGGEERAITGRKCHVCKGRGKVGLGKGRANCVMCSGVGMTIPVGPLRRISGDAWAALAVAVTWTETRQ